MKTIIAAGGLVLCMAGAAYAQLTLESAGSPGAADGLASLALADDTNLRDDDAASNRACQEQARSFRARNEQSPTRRQQELAACLASAADREQVEVAGP